MSRFRFEYKVMIEDGNGYRGYVTIEANTAKQAVKFAEDDNIEIAALSVEIISENENIRDY